MPGSKDPMLTRSGVGQALQRKPECLSPEQLEALLDTSASHPHLQACPRCQAELAMLRAFESVAPLPNEGAAVAWISARLAQRQEQIKHPGRNPASTRNGQSWWNALFAGQGRWLAPAALVVVFGVAGFLVFHHPAEPDLRADAGQGPVIYRSQQVETIGPNGELAATPEKFRWQAVSGAVQYKVTLMEVDKTAVWNSTIGDVVLTIPAAVRDKMLPGKPLLWQVQAVDSQGKVLATSQIQRFSVQRKPNGSPDALNPK